MKTRNFAALALVFIFAITGCSKTNAQSGGGGSGSKAPDFGYVMTEDGTGIKITYYTGEGGKVVIPAKIENFPVKEIGEDFPFLGINRNTVTSIVIPDSMEKIGRNAFEKCGELTELIIPASITKIDFKGSSFAGCGKLPIATRQRLKDLGYNGSF